MSTVGSNPQPSQHPRLLRLILAATVFGLVMIAALVLSELRYTSSSQIELTDSQVALLSSDPHFAFYAARRWEELARSSLLRRLPRYVGVSLIADYYKIHPTGYAHVIARHIPFRISNDRRDCGAGLEAAAGQVFHKPVEQLTSDDLHQLLMRSKAPLRFPCATAERN
jgi:hypothetical protein